MTDRNDYEEKWYITRDGEKVDYDPLTKQPPVVYGKDPFTQEDCEELETVDGDGFIIHESHGEYELYPGDEPSPSPVYIDEADKWTPVEVDKPDFDPPLTAENINGYEPVPPWEDQLAPENGKFHIRYYGVVEHAQFVPNDPQCFGERHSGLVSLAIRGMGDDHLHTDLHTFNPLSLLAEGSCPPGSKVRVDIQDFDNVILDYIYNYPRQLFYEDYADSPEEFLVQTFLELGQWDGNKKMRLIDMLRVLDDRFGTELGTLTETLKKYVDDHKWIEAVPTQLGMTLDPGDGITLPYSHLPEPFVAGSFDFNPATHIGALSFDYVDYILVPTRDNPRIFQMKSPQLFRAGTIPEAVRPKQNMPLVAYAEATIRSGCSEVVDEDRDAINLMVRPDGSVWVDGTLWFQHHEVGRPGVKENDRWRVEISSRGGVMLL